MPEETMDSMFDKMDPDVLCRAYDFTWAYIRALDSQSCSGKSENQDG